MDYKSIELTEELSIEHLYTVHYFEYMNNFAFPGESHNFWEFLYVDKGAADITSGSTVHRLEKGEIIFHKPEEFHTVTADGQTAPNLIVISFACSSPHMDFFKDKILKLDEIERHLLASIITEAKESFAGRLDDPYQKAVILKEEPPFASLQLMKLYMEHFLIHMLRRCRNPLTAGSKSCARIPGTTTQHNDEAVFARITGYLEAHLSEHLTIRQICHENLIGRSQLQKLFHEQSGLGIIEYFCNMKINAAKHMMRTNHMNFTQISEKLGYSSIHYFSRQFRKITGMTPSEYVSSIKALSEIK